MDGAIVQVAPDGTVTYRASAIGGCVKALLAARLEYDAAPVPEKVQALFRSGHEAEGQVRGVVGYLEHGPLEFDQLEVRLQVVEGVYVVGHVDGLHMPPMTLFDKNRFRGSDEAVLVGEIKSQSQREWDRRKKGERGVLRDRYDWQVSVYMHALGLPAVVWWANRETGEVEKEEIKGAPISRQKIEARVKEIERLAEAGVIGVSCNAPMWPCPYFYLHDDEDEKLRLGEWDEFEREEVDERVVNMLAESYVRNRREERMAGERKERAKVALRAQWDGKRGLKTEAGWRVTFFEGSRVVEVRRRVEDDPWRQEVTWEQIRVTAPKDG